MRTFFTVAALVAVADAKLDKELAKLLNRIDSFDGPNPDAVASPPGGGLFGRHKSTSVAFRLSDGDYCQEMVALQDNKMFLLPSGLEIVCDDTACLEAWSKLTALRVTHGKGNVRCLLPQPALKGNAPKSLDTKWRRVAGTKAGTKEFVRLQLPRAGLPCVAFKCADRSQCKQGFPSLVHMCTDDEPSPLTVGEIFAVVVSAVRRRHGEGASGSNALQQDAKAAPRSAESGTGGSSVPSEGDPAMKRLVQEGDQEFVADLDKEIQELDKTKDIFEGISRCWRCRRRCRRD